MLLTFQYHILYHLILSQTVCVALELAISHTSTGRSKKKGAKNYTFSLILTSASISLILVTHNYRATCLSFSFIRVLHAFFRNSFTFYNTSVSPPLSTQLHLSTNTPLSHLTPFFHSYLFCHYPLHLSPCMLILLAFQEFLCEASV